MLRVLHCVYGMNRGGIETFIMNVYRNIDRSKIQFDFLVHTKQKCHYDDEIKSLGGRIFYIPSRREGLIKNLYKINEFFKKHNEYRIIHVHRSSLSDINVLKIAKKHGIPYRIIHGHSTRTDGNLIHDILHKINKLFIKNYANIFFACSNSAAKWMYTKKIYKNRLYQVINNGIEVEKFSFNRKIRELKRKEFGIENDKFVIGHVGRFHPVKNHDFLIDVFKEIYGQDKKTILLLVGDGELKTKIENKIKKEGLNNNVIFAGVRSDVNEILQAIDIFVFPSIYEGFPVTLVEAQTSGLPCVVSDSITKEVKLTDKMFFLTLSKTEWVNKILQIKANFNRQDESEKIVNKNFHIRTIAKYLEELYLNC